MKELLIACLLSVVFCSGNVYSNDTSTIFFHIDSLNVYDTVADYMEMDVSLGKNFYQVSGLIGFTNNGITLLSGTGYGFEVGERYVIEGRVVLDYFYILLDKSGNGTIDYYSVINGKLTLLDSATITILGVK